MGMYLVLQVFGHNESVGQIKFWPNDGAKVTESPKLFQLSQRECLGNVDIFQ